jgi:6-pyruvoyltetrahydropterin/6-carboxytetrahydropterin synthase
MKKIYKSTKLIELGSCAFRQWRAESHCAQIHGYRLMAKFTFGCESLDNKNWCVDFSSLKDLKKQLQDVFDHTVTLAADDPFLDKFRELHNAGVVNLKIFDDGVGIEKTAEFCFNAASKWISEQYGDRCWVEQVEVFEHEANSAIYKKNND